MDCKLLHSFIAIAEERSFRKAARRLYTTQPPLTRQMRLLEAEIGAQLLDRKERGGVSLTRSGQVFLKDARALLSEIELARRRAQEAEPSRDRLLTIANYSLLTIRVLPALMKNFQRAHPDIGVSILEIDGKRQVEELLQRRIDIGLMSYFGLPRFNGIEASYLFDLPLVVLFGEGHPLEADERETVPLNAIAAEEVFYITKSRGPCYGDWLPDIYWRSGMDPCCLKPAEDLQEVLTKVATGDGVAILPQLFTGNVAFASVANVKSPELRSRKLDLTMPPYRLSMLIRSEPQSELIEAFRETVTTTLDGHRYSSSLPLL